MGLGGVSVASDYPEVSKDELERILNSLKNRFQNGNYPNYKERIEEESKMTNTFFNGLRMLIICINSFFKLRT